MGFFDDLGRVVRQGVARVTGAVTRVTTALDGSRTLPVLDPPAGQPTSIAEVIEEMRELAAGMPDGDGVADFGDLEELRGAHLVDATLGRKHGWDDGDSPVAGRFGEVSPWCSGGWAGRSSARRQRRWAACSGRSRRAGS
jgi:hypothetical protein